MNIFRGNFLLARLACVVLVLLLYGCQLAIRLPDATAKPSNTPALAQAGVAQDRGPAVKIAHSATPQLSSTPSPSLTPQSSSTPAFSPAPLPTSVPASTSDAKAARKPNPALAVPPCQERQGKIETQTIDAGPEGLTTYTVYLPPCYTAHPSRRYPVLYLLHGMNNDNLQWVRIGAPAAADALISSGQARPFLIVMPKEDNFYEDPDQSNFGDALVNVLLPGIDQQYATCTERNCRAIGGLSRGSGWALRIGLTDWQVFGAIGGHSLSPFTGDQDRLPDWLALSTASEHPRIYIDIGTYDQAFPDAKQIADTLSEMRVPHEWHLFEGAHNEDYWKAHIRDYLIWYASAW